MTGQGDEWDWDDVKLKKNHKMLKKNQQAQLNPTERMKELCGENETK